MPVPRRYRKSGEGSLASYNNINFLLKKGNLVFYGGKTENGYALDTATFYSTVHNSTQAGGTKTVAAVDGALDFNIDFVGELETPIQVEGNCIVQVPVLHHISSGTAVVATRLSASLLISGSSITTLGTATAVLSSSSLASNGVQGYTRTLNFEIPRTTLKRGDTIRLKLETNAPGANQQIAICHDPINRTATDAGLSSPGGTFNPKPDSTAITLTIPTRLDI